MKFSLNFFTALALAQLTIIEAFAPNNVHRTLPKTSSSSSLDMMPMDGTHMQMVESSINSASTFLSTISADIDNIPENEFATVFAGGIAVMIGGVISTAMVGFMLESGNSYASVVADSYAQGGDDEFWDNLSPEEAEKTRELLAKIREAKEAKERSGEDTSLESEAEKKISAAFESASVSSPVENIVDQPKAEKKESDGSKKEVSMFSDYDD